jgi:hypothetical protein
MRGCEPSKYIGRWAILIEIFAFAPIVLAFGLVLSITLMGVALDTRAPFSSMNSTPRRL